MIEISERYLDMLIYQSYLNEDKLGAKSDSVASKLEMIKQQIITDHEITQRLKESIKAIESLTDKDTIYESNNRILKLVLPYLKSILENKK